MEDGSCPSPPSGALELQANGVDVLYLRLGERNATVSAVQDFELRAMNYVNGCDPVELNLETAGDAGDAVVECFWRTTDPLTQLRGDHHSKTASSVGCYVWWKPDRDSYAILSPERSDGLDWCISDLEPDRIAGSFTFYDALYDQWVHISYSAHNGDMAWWQDRSERPCLHYYYNVPRGMAWSGAW